MCFSLTTESSAAWADRDDILLAGHHRGRVRVASDERRHDRAIDDAQADQVTTLQQRVDDRGPIEPHLASSDRVVNGVDSLPKDRSDLVVTVHACGKQIACPPR